MNDIKYIIGSGSAEALKHIDKGLLKTCYRDMGIRKAVAYVFVSDETLLAMNKASLQHDYYTDILTFDYSDDPDIECSEIYISTDRVAENAKAFAVSFREELMRVCLHGLLHLGGYSDKSVEEIEKMRSMENQYLALLRST